MGSEKDVLWTIYPSKIPLCENANSVERREPLPLKTTTCGTIFLSLVAQVTVVTTAVGGRSGLLLGLAVELELPFWISRHPKCKSNRLPTCMPRL